ncbi:MAG: A/G-specific adenine glycosylase [Patescibacteria group bacterium]|nr:A/G-specific adenine glycosylase [Patescibacteria group bacterium]
MPSVKDGLKKIISSKATHFKRVVWNHYHNHGRDFPWRHSDDPYAIVVSEIMLQQTQVDRVRGKYEYFLQIFPDFFSLACASSGKVLRAWQGLGYNRRALALHRLAKIVVKEYGGILPRAPELLKTFPGIGNATAGSIVAFAFNMPTVFIETNIRRAVIHHFFPKKKSVSENDIYTAVVATCDRKNPCKWYWALMDYGAMIGKTLPNPNKRSKIYRAQSAFRGSTRELRGYILRLLLEYTRMDIKQVMRVTRESAERVDKVIDALEREGFLRRKGVIIILPR